MDSKIQIFAIELEFRLLQLLKTARPSNLKAFQLYKRSQQEEAFLGSYEAFCECLFRFYSLPNKLRSPQSLGSILKSPIPNSFFNEFILDFGNSNLDSKQILQIKEWCAERIPLFKDVPVSATQGTIIYKAIESALKYGARHRSFSIEWIDFIDVWEQECFKQYGARFEQDFKKLKTLRIDKAWNLKPDVDNEAGTERTSTLQLTQTEIDWLLSLQKSLCNNTPFRDFPLSRGPSKGSLIKLNNLVRSMKYSPGIDLNDYRSQLSNTLTDLLKFTKMTA